MGPFSFLLSLLLVDLELFLCLLILPPIVRVLVLSLQRSCSRTLDTPFGIYARPSSVAFRMNHRTPVDPRASPSRADPIFSFEIYKFSVLDVWPVLHGGVVCPFPSFTSLTTCQPTTNLAYEEDSRYGVVYECRAKLIRFSDKRINHEHRRGEEGSASTRAAS